MPNSKPRVDIPSNPADRLALSARVYAKHIADGPRSPLNALQNEKWDENGPQIVTAKTHHDDAEDLQRKANLEYRKRDLITDKIDISLKSSRDLLLSIFHDNPKELSNWGFDVSDTPRAAAKKE
jgi:hypothetical protein